MVNKRRAMKRSLASLAVIAVISICSCAHADVVWNENFSDVGDWIVGYDPSGGSTVTSDGSLGLLYVNGANTLAAFIPNNTIKPYTPFNPAEKNKYTLNFNINSLTWSTSYDIALDVFDSSKVYIATVWNVFPVSSTTTATGSYSVGLGGFTFGANAAYLMPKITVHTGDPAQTVKIDNMSFSYNPAPTENFVTFDNFDSHTWVDSNDPAFKRGTFSYNSNRKSQGTNAWRVTSGLDQIPPDGDLNINKVQFTLTRNLPQPEDWSVYDFITADIYMEDNPTDLPIVNLTLYNSQSTSATVPLIMGWQLFQWENRQMTWPLKGNQYFVSPIPNTILSDVVKVSISPARYNDSEFGVAMKEINFHIDNMRLNGKDMWDAFDGPAYDWRAGGDSSAVVGITHNSTYNNSAGALYLSWNYAGIANYAEAMTKYLDGTDSGGGGLQPYIPLNWSGFTNIKANVKCSDTTVPITIFLWDGGAGREAAPKFVQTANQWQTLCWDLPADDAQFSKANITVVKVVAKNIDVHTSGTIYVDNLEVGKYISAPRSLSAKAGNLENYISWKNPADPNFLKTMVRYRIDRYPTSYTDGTLVCEKTNSPDTEDGFTHTGLNSSRTYYYSAFAYNGTTYSAVNFYTQAQASQNMIRVSGSNYEIGFSKTNGAIVYIKDKTVGKTVSRGSDEGALWKILFCDENTMPSLSAGEFSPSSTAKRFSYTTNPLVLTYSYNQNGQTLALSITVTAATIDHFDLKAQITNNTGLPIRAVSLPNRITFDKTKVDRVLLPLEEGLVLLQSFFTNSRDTYFTRPPLFADCLALNSLDGRFAVYTVQDSLYQANMIPNHDPAVPAFQPNNLGVGTIKNMGYFNFDMVTYIPNAATWNGATVRFNIGNVFKQIAVAYRHDNAFDDTVKYPTLKQKLDRFSLFDSLAKSPILTIEASKAMDLPGVPLSQEWSTIANSWLPNLPTPSVIHLTHWQYGRDWYSNPSENHKVEDDHPDCQPIWWARYGTESDFLTLLNKMSQGGFLSMPFTNWTVWNKVVPGTHDLPALSQTPAAARKLRGSAYPFIEYKGYMVKPWHNDTIARDAQMITLYTNTYPQDILFLDTTGERYWRYVLMDDNVTGSASAYTQSVADEDLRMSASKPLFTEGIFDRIANSIVGYCHTVKQKAWNGVLNHLGTEYQEWTAYPFAADVIHNNVAFYQHNLNLEVSPDKGASLFTYYTTFGYNYIVDICSNYGNTDYWIDTCDAFQKAVNSRTFGQLLVDYQNLTTDNKHIRTIWGDGTNNITITANFDTLNTYAVGNNTVAKEGFLATTANGDVQAGVFDGTFNGAVLTSGVHWLTVENVNNLITIRQPQGPDTNLTVNRPSGWINDNEIYLVKALKNGTEILGSLSSITPTTLVFNFNAVDPVTGYALGRYKIYGNQSSSVKPPFFTSVPTAKGITPTSENITWTTDASSNSVVEYGLTASYGSSTSDANYVTSHQILLTGLTYGQTYHYRVKSTDPAGHTTTSGDFTFVAQTVTVWNEDFSDVSDWVVGYDPSGGSTITSDGALGLLYVNGANTVAAFIPNTTVKPFAPFNPAKKGQYTLCFNINSLTWSTSYDIALDEFDSNRTYIGTVWNIFPASGTSAAIGSQNVDLGGYSFNASAVYLMPKITVHTGDDGQTVRIDDMSFNYENK